MKRPLPHEAPALPTNEDDWEKLRARAETLLGERPRLPVSPGEVDLARLIQDLRVHQIELELQNEELRRAQRELEESRDAFSRLFNQAPVGYVSIDRHGRISRFNRTFLDLSGRPEAEIVDRPFADLLLESDRPIFHARFKAFFKSPEGQIIQVRLKRSAGESLTVRLSGRCEVVPLLKSGSEEDALRLFMLVHDISEVVVAEERAREKSALCESLFMCLPFEAWARDVRNRVIVQNQNSIDHWGKMDGMNPGDVTGLQPETFSRWEENNRRALAGETVRGEFQDGERTVFNIIAPVRDGERTIGTVGINIDITDRKRAESDRLEMERRLLHAQKLESLGVLAGGIAHDFNNLLVAILGNLDLALDDLPAESELRESVEHAMRASRRACDLTRQMLAYSGRGRFVVTPLSLNDLVQENLRILRVAGSPTVTMDVRLEAALPMIMADAGQLQQVVMNLITNASEAIGDHPGTMVVSTSVVEFEKSASASVPNIQPEPLAPGRYVKLEVADDGCGMDGETQKRLFEPFFSTKFTGRGLGMSAVLGIVRGHKGGIAVTSEPGRGTTIRVFFPALADEAKTGAGDEGQSRGVALTVSSALGASKEACGGTILIVDDDDMVRDLCEAMVRRCGFQPLSAADGRQALELFDAHRGEIRGVILDLTMPTMDGVTAFDAFISREPRLRILLSSGYSEEDVLRQFRGRPVAGFLQKPFEFEIFCQTLAKAF